MRKLAIISHTRHYYKKNGELVGWEPTIREINHLQNIFDIIYHVAPIYNVPPNQANICYNSDKIIFVPIKPTGGKGLRKKLGILFYMPYNLFYVIKTFFLVDWIHFRAPTNLGIFVLPLLSLFPNKKKWIKYAGNWKQRDIPRSYLLQRWWLEKNIQNSFVTINGKWEKQTNHLLSFENPCITIQELQKAKKIGEEKFFSGKLNICFVGSISENKGVLKLISALTNICPLPYIDEINIVGVDCEDIDISRNQTGLTINFLGWLNRESINQVYNKSHFIVLPTTSEGFPKVIAEAASFGCIPIVTNIEPINQYIIHHHNGLLLQEASVIDLERAILEIKNKSLDLKKISKSIMKMADLFSFSYYLQRIKTEILNG